MFSLSLAKMKSRIEHFEKVLCVQTIQLIRCLLYPGNGVVVACSTIVASNPATEKIKLILAILKICRSCDSVGRAVASNIRGPQFESSHFVLNICLLSIVLKRRK